MYTNIDKYYIRDQYNDLRLPAFATACGVGLNRGSHHTRDHTIRGLIFHTYAHYGYIEQDILIERETRFRER